MVIKKKIKIKIVMAKDAFNRKTSLLTRKLSIELKKKLVTCYVWRIDLYGSEAWKLRKLDCKYLESFEIWCWRRMEKIKLSQKVTNYVLECIGEKRKLLNYILHRKTNWNGYILKKFPSS